MRLKRKLPPPDLGDYERHSMISRRDAVWLIAREIQSLGDDTVKVQNRVSHRLGVAIESDQLSYCGERKKILEFGYVAAWAQNTWPGKFSGWPMIRNVVISPPAGTITAKSQPPSIPPNDLEGWRTMAKRLEAENLSLRQENVMLHREVAALRQFKEHIERRRQQNSKSGKMARGVSKSGRFKNREI